MVFRNDNKRLSVAAGRRDKNLSGSRPAGFTLVEVLVAAMVLMIPICGILLAYFRCLELNQISTDMSIAVQAARNEMETIKDTPFSSILSTYNGKVFHPSGMNAAGVSYVDQITPTQLLVTISVSWKQDSGRVFGEDANLNGVVDPGEDTNGNGRLDSPVELQDIVTDY